MQFKVIEIRDEGTRIDALAIRMLADSQIQSHYIHSRSGYPRDGSSIMLMRLADGRSTNDPYEWPTITGDRRTMPNAHNWIIDHFGELEDGDVVDVQFLLKETAQPKIAERLTVGVDNTR